MLERELSWASLGRTAEKRYDARSCVKPLDSMDRSDKGDLHQGILPSTEGPRLERCRKALLFSPALSSTRKSAMKRFHVRVYGMTESD